MIPTSWLYRLLGSALAAAVLLWLVQSRDHWRDRARSSEQLYLQAQAAQAATVADYRAAAERARLQDAANLARVRGELAKINERSKDEFENRIVDARARAERLRRQGTSAATDRGPGGGAPVPGIPVAAGGAAQGAAENGLSQSDRLMATEQAIQLDELIKWLRRQAGIAVTASPGPRESSMGTADPANKEDEERQ